MPQKAFVPAALTEAQPRVYRSFRGRQIRGLALAAAGATVSLALSGAQDLAGYLLTFASALPGFAYGYFQAQGKPLEIWMVILARYYFGPQSLGAPTQRTSPWITGWQLFRAWRYLAWRWVKGRGLQDDG